MNPGPSDQTGSTSGVAIRSTRDISDALVRSREMGGIILTEQDLCPDFFNLRTGLAGEVFQKFVTYQALLAIVLPDPNAYGERFSELVFEHRRHAAVRFFASMTEARLWMDSANRATDADPGYAL